jgi:ABC-type bacteriocin/lantibiotic exporter with double-glycine peptidase domain
LFLDEGTAHLDGETAPDKFSLCRLNITRISVAHRSEMASGADRIVKIARTGKSLAAIRQ